MPTYEYECSECGFKFERFQQMTDLPLSKCPQCGGKVKRLIGSGGGIIMKNPGTANSCCGESAPCDDPKRCCGL